MGIVAAYQGDLDARLQSLATRRLAPRLDSTEHRRDADLPRQPRRESRSGSIAPALGPARPWSNNLCLVAWRDGSLREPNVTSSAYGA
jgi:hypothetical protein